MHSVKPPVNRVIEVEVAYRNKTSRLGHLNGIYERKTARGLKVLSSIVIFHAETFLPLKMLPYIVFSSSHYDSYLQLIRFNFTDRAMPSSASCA